MTLAGDLGALGRFVADVDVCFLRETVMVA